NQIGASNIPGLTRFYDGGPSSSAYGITFDNGTTSFDKVFKFTVKAQDPANLSEFEKTFFIRVTNEDNLQYTDLYLRALQQQDKRNVWYDFITN
ncbi:hypothetical protein ABK046_45575, partial [Streptomyces caeruleatus]